MSLFAEVKLRKLFDSQTSQETILSIQIVFKEKSDEINSFNQGPQRENNTHNIDTSKMVKICGDVKEPIISKADPSSNTNLKESKN